VPFFTEIRRKEGEHATKLTVALEDSDAVFTQYRYMWEYDPKTLCAFKIHPALVAVRYVILEMHKDWA